MPFDVNQFVNDPWTRIGLGILSSNAPGASFGQAVGRGGLLGLQSYQQMQAMAAAQEKMKREEEERQRQMQAQSQWMQQNMPHLMNAPQALQNEAFKSQFQKPTDDIREYQQAVQQGFKGTFMDYMTQLGSARAMKIDLSPKTGGLDFSNESSLRKEYLNATKEYWPVRDSFERVQASIEDPSAAGDMALIFNYMKMLDPGSTVREGEFATAQNSGSIPKRLQALYNNAISGQRFTPEQRADFADRAQKLFQKQHNKFGIINKYYSGLASSYNFDPSRIVRDMGELSIEREQAPQEQSEPDESRTINGVTYYRFGDKWMQQ